MDTISFVAGVGASVTAALIGHFFREAALPYISQQTNKHIAVNGDWFLKHTGTPVDGDGLEASWTVKIELIQFGQTVSGKAHAACVDLDGPSHGKQVPYNVKGKFVNGVLDACFIDSDASTRNRSVFLMQLVGDGASLQGYRLFLGRNRNQIRAIACEWLRSDGPARCGTA